MTDTAPRTDSWTVAGRTFNSRLIVGTGKYRDYAQNAAAAEASGAEMVTVAVRRPLPTRAISPTTSPLPRMARRMVSPSASRSTETWPWRMMTTKN